MTTKGYKVFLGWEGNENVLKWIVTMVIKL